MQREVARDFVRQVRVGLFHACNRSIKTGIWMELAFFEIAHVFNPRAQTLAGRAVHTMSGRKSDALDRHCFAHPFGIDAGVVQHDHAPERVPDQPDGNSWMISSSAERSRTCSAAVYMAPGAQALLPCPRKSSA